MFQCSLLPFLTRSCRFFYLNIASFVVLRSTTYLLCTSRSNRTLIPDCHIGLSHKFAAASGRSPKAAL
ncbi:hypothetical protein BC629DRAFT_1509836 [Irpex lacteus]|nr:hypothetical protein BC629DRAFT_1509836 [Irpex lacteus]